MVLAMDLRSWKLPPKLIPGTGRAMSLYSETAAIQFDIRNPEPKVTVEANPWYLILLGVLLTAAAVVYLSFWKKRL